MICLYGHELSGNSYKVKLMLALLGLEFEWRTVDLLGGEHRQPEFLALNPAGQVPVLVDDETVIADSQGILIYLVRKYGNDVWLPLEPEAMSQVAQWLSVALGEVRQGPENARLYYMFKVTSINVDRATEQSHRILTLLDQHLSDRDWLALGRPTVADVAVFPYVALARDGKIDLDRYPKVLAWIERVTKLPGFIGMRGIDVPQTA